MYFDIVKYLVQNTSVDANEKTQNGFFGRTAYEEALKEQHRDVAEFLLQYMKPKISVSKERTCNKNEFKCDNGDCVKSDFICDGLHPQCIDKSDLQFCARNFSNPCVGPVELLKRSLNACLLGISDACGPALQCGHA